MSVERRRRLAAELAALTPQQPATVFWRAIELDCVLAAGTPRGRGIDVGCGDGSIVSVLRAHGADWSLVGLDADPLEVELARGSGQYERVHGGDAAAIAEPDASFEFAFSNSVLEHIPGLEAVLAEIARVLAPGGRLLATVPSDGLERCVAGPGVLAPLLGREREEYLRGLAERTAHVNLWSAERWRRELEAAGFAEVRLTPYLSCAETRIWERMSNWSGGLAWGLARRRRHPLELTRAARLGSGSPARRALAAPARVIVAAALRRAERSATRGPDSQACLLIEAERAAA